jgi:hypothetical protein
MPTICIRRLLGWLRSAARETRKSTRLSAVTVAIPSIGLSGRQLAQQCDTSRGGAGRAPPGSSTGWTCTPGRSSVSVRADATTFGADVLLVDESALSSEFRDATMFFSTIAAKPDGADGRGSRLRTTRGGDTAVDASPRYGFVDVRWLVCVLAQRSASELTLRARALRERWADVDLAARNPLHFRRAGDHGHVAQSVVRSDVAGRARGCVRAG